MGFDFSCKDTICALSTPQGLGGVALIRVSGKKALEITRKFCPKLPAQPQSHTIHFTPIETSAKENIDEVLVSFFREGKSYTGEETTEISCHGSPVVVSSILQELVSGGCRPADRGEFTFRSFVNGNLDLTQAEGVLSVIESQSKQASRMALRQLQGELSKILDGMENQLIFVLANLEASIDFSTEDIDVLEYDKCVRNMKQVLEMTDKLINSYKSGKILKNGYQIALVGRPNAGKSSLLNALISEERAIVSEIPGTTRDVVAADLMVDGMQVQLFDTAGIHETQDRIEKMGIERTHKTIDGADMVVYLVDGVSTDEIQWDSIDSQVDKNLVFLISKADLISSKLDEIKGQVKKILKARYPSKTFPIYSVSSKTQAGIEELLENIAKTLKTTYSYDSAVIFQSRHYDLLLKVRQSILKALDLFHASASQEFITFELQDAIFSIHEILGKRFDDQIMDRVFQEFCIGK